MTADFDKLATDIESGQRDHGKAGKNPAIIYKHIFSAFILHALQLPGDTLAAMRARVTHSNSELLIGAARGAAIWSIRDNDASWFEIGLGALLLENGHRDYRESITEACLMNYSGSKLRFDLRPVFEKVRRLGDLTSTAMRGVENLIKTGINDIDQYGYEEGTDRAGEFTYKQMRY